MTRNILLLSVILLLATHVHTSGQVSFRAGIKGGLNFADLNRDITTESRTGFHGGAFITLKIAKVALQPELIYSAQGSKLVIDNFDDVQAKFNYLNIPIMMKFYVIGGFNIQVGPQFGFLTSGDQDIPIDPLNGEIDIDRNVDAKKTIEDSDVSLGLGVGFDLPLRLTISARYNLGLSDINDSEASESIKNQVFQISVGYRLIELGDNNRK